MKTPRPQQPLPTRHQPRFAFAAALAVLLLPFPVCAQTVVTSGVVFPFPNPNPVPGGDWNLGNPHFVFTIQKNPDAADVVLIPEITSDLTATSWNSGPSHLTVVEETSTLLKVRDNTPLPNHPRRFMRVRASLVSP